MTLGKVIGSVVSTMKHSCYENKKMMLIKPISPAEKEGKGVMVAVDLVGAGKDDVVIISSEGRAAQELLDFPTRMPLRSIIVGIVDKIDMGEA